jgi:hypothetical protein
MTLFQAMPEDAICRAVAHSQEDHAALGFDLDFRKIKWNLSCGSMKTKLLLFQALRWVSPCTRQRGYVSVFVMAKVVGNCVQYP